MPYTGDAIYYQPLKPRIRIYAQNDSTYSTPLYSYNPFTAVRGDPNAPSSLIFDTSLGNVGGFDLTIENNDDIIDPETLRKGNRVFVDGSKDGTTWQAAYKGLVRSSEDDIFANKGKNLIIHGYNNLIRYTERLLNVIKESTKVAPGGENDPYDRTDSAMFTNNLAHDLAQTNANYVRMADDGALYGFVKNTNLLASPITTWVPIVNAELSTVLEAFNRMLDYSGSYLSLNFANDELFLYNPEVVTSDTNIFLVTTVANKNADDADTTMYPRDRYKHRVGYDFDDYANRLVVSYRDPRTNVGEDLVNIPDCPDTTIPGSEPSILDKADLLGDFFSQGDCRVWATQFYATASPFKEFRTVCKCEGNVSTHDLFIRIFNNGGSNTIGSSVGSDIEVYRGADDTVVLPSSNRDKFMVGMPEGVTGPSLTVGSVYWISMRDVDAGSLSNRVGWNYANLGDSKDAMTDCGSFPGGWLYGAGSPSFPKYVLEYAESDVTIPGCPGFVEPEVNHDKFITARDAQAQKQVALVERPMTSLPPGTLTGQTLIELMFAKLKKVSKPRFDFTFPSLTMPGKIPKAGDLCVHVDTLTTNKVGTRTTPMQVGLITNVRMEFGTDQENILGLKKLSLNTSGIRKGYY
jgi:hypothetical protein